MRWRIRPTRGAWPTSAFAAGLEEGAHEGTDWSDGDCYKWLEAMAHVYGATRDPELDRQMDEVIAWIAGAQEADGYLNTQITLDPAKRRWQNVHHHELYNAGHCFTAAAVHLEATGKRSLLEVAVRLADYLCGVFLPTPPTLANFGFNPSQIVGLVDLYRVTGERRYLELAGVFVSNRGSEPDPGFNGDLNQDRVPLRDETAAVGHAVTATYLWAGAADVYAETGETAVLRALERIWNDIVATKLYLTGAVGADHFSASIRNDPVHEAFGLPHDLPNATAYTETCANIGQGMWAWRMAALTGDAHYGDVLEQVLYNSGLSGMSADGTRFCYTNPLRWYGSEHRGMSNDTPERWFTHICYCCPPQVARTIARLHRWAYGLADDAVWVHLYGGSRLQAEVAGGALVLEQKTDYPWDGAIAITLEEAPAAAVHPAPAGAGVGSWRRVDGCRRAGRRRTGQLRRRPPAVAGGRPGHPHAAAARRAGHRPPAPGAGPQPGRRGARPGGLLPGSGRSERRGAARRDPPAARLRAGGTPRGRPPRRSNRAGRRGHPRPEPALERRALPPRRRRGPQAGADPDDPLLRLAQPRQPPHDRLAPPRVVFGPFNRPAAACRGGAAGWRTGRAAKSTGRRRCAGERRARRRAPGARRSAT